MKLSVFLFFLLISWNCFSQTDTSGYKLDLGNPLDNGIFNTYPNSPGSFRRHSPDSILISIDGKFYHAREIDMWTDDQMKDFDKRVESIDVVENKRIIDSLLCNRIKTIFIIRLKEPGN